MAKGMKISTSKLPAIQHQWHFGGLYFASPDKLDPKVPFVDKPVRQAMNMAINRKPLRRTSWGEGATASRVMGFHRQAGRAIWPGIWNPDWDKRFEDLYGYDPTKAKALLAQAGYAQGFEFTLYLYTLPGLPEIVDIGQAMALDWQAIGLKPKLVEIDFPRVREQYRTKSIHGALCPCAMPRGPGCHPPLPQSQGFDGVYAYEHPFIDERLETLSTVVDSGKGRTVA